MMKDHRFMSAALRGCLLLLLLLAALCTCAQEQVEKPYTIVNDTLGQSKIMLVVPKQWNKQMLMLAHGLRMENSPLTAEFTVDDDTMLPLLKEGWLIASTSYRRNGYLHDEAVEDLDQLRQHLIDTYGQPTRIYLLCASMGGGIGTKIAETRQGKYDGVVAVGAALNIGFNKFSFAPQMPLLFISNQNELGEPTNYRKLLTETAPVKPVTWVVKRDGHCNLNDKETIVVLRALFAWRETGNVEDNKDDTIVITPPSVARFADGGAYTHLTGAKVNVDTQLTAADLEKLSIARGDHFTITFGEKTETVLLGVSYFDVPRGGWVAFVKADGYVRIARNFDSVIAVLGCKAGDELFIKAVPKPVEHK